METTVRVAHRRIGPGQPVFVVAEIGATHGGRLDVALALVESAARCGVDAVKLQTIAVDESYVPGEPSYEIFKNLWFERTDLAILRKSCEERGLVLFSTPGDFASLDLLVELGVPLLKISSGLLTNLPLVRRAAGTGIPLVVSTGMSHLDEVEHAVRAAEEAGCRELLLMHCVSLYPAPARSLNLSVLPFLARDFACPVGYSDHHDGFAACLAATALGARAIEKHFTLDRNQEGPDHAFSSDPEEMSHLVLGVREVETMLGNPRKAPAPEEVPARDRYRRCLVAKRAITRGEVLSGESIGLKRPRAGKRGLSPDLYDRVLGRQAASDIPADESLTWDMIADGERS
ncbi:MAG: N-acetylneuraminate synthase family protein [Planctomycetes bacterium]|nr:N-acetylneuraminate synthase family protein [Planctomycetota bacterium]